MEEINAGRKQVICLNLSSVFPIIRIVYFSGYDLKDLYDCLHGAAVKCDFVQENAM